MRSPYSTPRKTHHLLFRLVTYLLIIVFVVVIYFAFMVPNRVPHADFTLLSGQQITTEQLRGKVYLIHFWATSCGTCIDEMPQLVNTYQAFKNKGLELIAVAMSYDAPRYVTHYTETHRLPFKVAIDDGSAAKSFSNVQLTPTTFVVDRNGRILKRYIGKPSFTQLHQLLETALDQETA